MLVNVIWSSTTSTRTRISPDGDAYAPVTLTSAGVVLNPLMTRVNCCVSQSYTDTVALRSAARGELMPVPNVSETLTLPVVRMPIQGVRPRMCSPGSMLSPFCDRSTEDEDDSTDHPKTSGGKSEPGRARK